VLVALVAASAALAGGGNSANAKLCQKGGWQTLQQSNGAPFANQSACVSYGAAGGTVFGPTLTVTDEGCDTALVPGQDVWVEQATGFTPNSSLTIEQGGESILWPRPFDSSGSITIFFVFDPGTAGLTSDVTFTDGNGVHASATLGPALNCSA
jgi:hypothetical protein